MILPRPVRALLAVVQVPTVVPQMFCCFKVAAADPADDPTNAPVPVRLPAFPDVPVALAQRVK